MYVVDTNTWQVWKSDEGYEYMRNGVFLFCFWQGFKQTCQFQRAHVYEVLIPVKFG